MLYGGRSGEHEISLRSAESIIAAMDPQRYDVERIFITPEGRWEPRAISPEPGGNPGIDVVFPVLHGTFGEDGTVQGLLELADLPYVGAGVLGSAVAMDKEVTKRLLRERGLPVAEFVVLARGEYDLEDICSRLPFPMFVKPANLGSSVGISKVKTCEELAPRAGIRRGVRSQDSGGARHRGARVRMLRARQSRPDRGDPLRDSAVARVLRLRRQVYSGHFEDGAAGGSDAGADARSAASGCRMLSRRCTARAWRAWISCSKPPPANSISTSPTPFPGFTSISMYPKMWEAAGVPYAELIGRLIDLALERHRERESHALSQVSMRTLAIVILLLLPAGAAGG